MAKRGPKPSFDRVGPNKVGAPMFSTRLNVEVYNHIKSRTEGDRKYVERLVAEDAERTGEPLGGLPGQIKSEDEGNE